MRPLLVALPLLVTLAAGRWVDSHTLGLFSQDRRILREIIYRAVEGRVLHRRWLRPPRPMEPPE